jgi:predicted ATP-binding protein involved in virulence
VNGAGKSSLLDGIAILLSTFVASSPGETANVVPLVKRDLRDGAKELSLKASITIDSETYELLHSAEIRFGSLAIEEECDNLALDEQLAENEAMSVPIACRYPASRSLTRKREQLEAPAHPFPQLHAYDKAFEEDLGPFQDLVQWFRFEEDIENEARARGERLTSPALDAVRAAVERFMSALPGERFSNLRAERSAPDFAFDKTSLVIDKAGQRLALSQLSDGERSLILLVSDVARRLAIANPGRPDPLSGSGIVLIDEIELHLHPGWQRAVLPGLRRAFPGLQIIVATHSPQVLSRVPAESVILLSDFQVEGAAPRTYGRDTNTILEEVMSVPARPEEMAARLKEIGRLIDSDHLVEARAALDQVAKTLGTTDSEVVRLETLIAFLGDGPAGSAR